MAAIAADPCFSSVAFAMVETAAAFSLVLLGGVAMGVLAVEEEVAAPSRAVNARFCTLSHVPIQPFAGIKTLLADALLPPPVAEDEEEEEDPEKEGSRDKEKGEVVVVPAVFVPVVPTAAAAAAAADDDDEEEDASA